MIAYRFLTEDDTSDFCHKVTKALADGWALYGNPTYAPCPETGKMRCGQAVTKEVPGVDYNPDVKLGHL